MICERYFRLKKNGEPTKYCYCRHPELIENYDKAIADTTQTWEVHHRLESCFTQKFLKKMTLYYDVEPEALIFLTKAEHRKIDSKCKRCSEAHKGKKHSEEHKRKISEALKGMKLPDEHKRKISEALKNRKDQSKKVLCIETGEIFDSACEAQRKTGISQSHISKVCNGRHRTAGGFHWRFV